ncbi:MAG: InlB B-repeat-containing protein, partial [Saccharofermentans sp.]|nr:InlB B-repeat-containing protein [Saccharofermentans sp.]
FAWGTNAYFQKPTPTKAPTAQYTYKFAGWDNKVTLVTGDVTYTAVYDKTVNQYTVTFVNADGKVLQTGLVDYGAMPTYDGETPVKAATVEYTYTFAGWDKEITKVQGDITYTATYSEKKFEKGDIDYVYFKVMFNSNGGSDVVTQLVQDGYTATIPDDPMRERYNFSGWYLDEDLTKPFSFSTPITSDITLYAKWVKGVQEEVTVTYAVVGDGTVKWEAGSSEGVVITVDRSQDNDTGAEHFKSVQIDGEEVAYFNYEVSEGSATITLSTDILKDMAPGTYKVTILFDDGQAEVDLVIEGGETPTEGVTETPTEAGDPATGDDGGNTTGPNYIGLWIALGVVALVCIAAAPILIIKRRGVK